MRDDDDDDDEDDASRARAPTLCYAGRLVSRAEARARARTRDAARGAHKVGGAPVAMTTRDAKPRARDADANALAWYVPRCASCARAMTLVVQTYAPRGGRGRALYAYACVGGGDGGGACRGRGAWTCVSARAIEDAVWDGCGVDDAATTRRGGRTSMMGGVEDATTTYGTREDAPAMEDAWDDPESSAWCDDGVDAAALSAELDAMLMSGAGGGREVEARATVATTTGEDDDDAASEGDEASLSQVVREAYDAACATQIVEYHLVAELEPKAVRGMTTKEAAHAEALLARYAEREGVSVADVIAIDDEDGEWTGETYERGEARARG